MRRILAVGRIGNGHWGIQTPVRSVLLRYRETGATQNVHVNWETDEGWFGRPADQFIAPYGIWPRTLWTVVTS